MMDNEIFPNILAIWVSEYDNIFKSYSHWNRFTTFALVKPLIEPGSLPGFICKHLLRPS